MNPSSRKDHPHRPLIALTLGDPAGIGPEIIARGWKEIVSDHRFRYGVVGQAGYLERAVKNMNLDIQVRPWDDPRHLPESDFHGIPVGAADSGEVELVSGEAELVEAGRIDARAGDAACRWIDSAISMTLDGPAAAIVTAPIHKEAIRLAGREFPGHTEMLASRCGVSDFAMMLYIPDGQGVGGEIGLGVVHTTLHQSLRSAIDDLSTSQILSRIRLAHQFALRSLQQRGLSRQPGIAVAALNPHAGENGLFGNEEREIIGPAIAEAQQLGISCQGPFSCDTLMGRAVAGEFDMVVAMYHDQGHIALKLLGMHKAVNVTLGLPIIRTSVAHGTAFEIAGTGQADPSSLLRAIEVARRLILQRQAASSPSGPAIA